MPVFLTAVPPHIPPPTTQANTASQNATPEASVSAFLSLNPQFAPFDTRAVELIIRGKNLLSGFSRTQADYRKSMGRIFCDLKPLTCKAGSGDWTTVVLPFFGVKHPETAMRWILLADVADGLAENQQDDGILDESSLEQIGENADPDIQASSVKSLLATERARVAKAKNPRSKDVTTFKATGVTSDEILKIKGLKKAHKDSIAKVTREFARQLSSHGPEAVLEALSQIPHLLGQTKAGSNA